MKVCTFTLKGSVGVPPRVGIVEGSEVLEVHLEATMLDLLRSRDSDRWSRRTGATYGLDQVLMRAPVPRPGKIVAAIVNTRAMLGGDDVVLTRPRVDMKAPSAVIGPGETILSPKSGIRPEVELAAVVGRTIHRASPEDAQKGIFGYTILNDVTAPSDSREDAYDAYRRDPRTGKLAKKTLRGPLFRSKNHDTFCPLGPWVVTPDEAGSLEGLRMTTRFDGSLVQEGSTSEYIFSPASIASYVSGFLTLEPGDLVSCGSVGWAPGVLGDLDPTEFVLPPHGGELELEIGGIGVLRNEVAHEGDRN